MQTMIRDNWFWPLALFLMAFVWLLAVTTPNIFAPGFELALIFDAVVTLPVLFFMCYRQSLSPMRMVIRIVALQCLGIWLASMLMPTSEQHVLPYLMWVRYVGLSVLVLIELKLALILFRLVFKPGVTEAELTESGVPRLLAKWALIEARVWRWIFRVFTK